ncbi:zeaxanthin epoxidase, chloroplastic [Colletotrichum liriopes]|uniref:Zeaxanthin epoxidase, chloroplastic n=1 Tax=Colletotrichum liriopes TaxID=708192 RepID=A0AA37LRD3_9PEZI|nr:zeaxanthin epoxidase, chloroplastic [Colletotrichum liriopes]
MRVLHNLDRAVYATIQKRGFAYKTVRLRTSSGVDLSIERRTERDDDVTMIMARQAVWRTLREAIPDDDIVIRKVLSVTKRAHFGNMKPVVSFADGGSVEFDLVVGADGVHSTVRKQVFNNDDIDYSAAFAPCVIIGALLINISSSKRCGIWGFISMSIPKEVSENESVVIILGDRGSMGYSAYRPTNEGSLSWWSVYETEEPPSRKEVPREFVSALLQRTFGHWEEKNIQTILQKASAPFIYPIWTVPDLPTWGDGGVVLIGDAAHAMTPDIGQGTSQAFEDSEAFGMILGHVLRKEGISEDDAIDLAVRGIYECRLPRLSKIKLLNSRAQSKGNNMQSKGFEQEDILYGWNVEEETRKVLEKYSQPL